MNTIRLEPQYAPDALGRSGFLIHADYADPAFAGQASLGCIIMPKDKRKKIADAATSGKGTLQHPVGTVTVVEGYCPDPG